MGTNKSRANPQRAITVDVGSGDILLPLPSVAAEFDRNRRTLARWIANLALGFRRPARINGRLYVSRRALEEWKRSRISASISGRTE